MPKITITFQEEGQPQLGFEMPDLIAQKIEAEIAAANSSTEVGVRTYRGKADWFNERCFTLILKPLLEKYPEPPPQEAIELMSRAAALQREAMQMIAERAVVPIRPATPAIEEEPRA